jgi:hypothetical protein
VIVTFPVTPEFSTAVIATVAVAAAAAALFAALSEAAAAAAESAAAALSAAVSPPAQAMVTSEKTPATTHRPDCIIDLSWKSLDPAS